MMACLELRRGGKRDKREERAKSETVVVSRTGGRFQSFYSSDEVIPYRSKTRKPTSKSSSEEGCSLPRSLQRKRRDRFSFTLSHRIDRRNHHQPRRLKQVRSPGYKT